MEVNEILDEIGFVHGVYTNGQTAPADTRYIYKNYMVFFHQESNSYSMKKITNDMVYSPMDLFSTLTSINGRNEIALFYMKDKDEAIEFLKEEFKHILRKGKIKKLLSL